MGVINVQDPYVPSVDKHPLEVHHLFILDCSTSMSGQKYRNAVSGIREEIEGIKTGAEDGETHLIRS